jgi:hypothetical protein
MAWPDFTAVVTSPVTAIPVAIVTLLLSVWLALRRFRAKRLWERKADAYAEILEVLHNSKALFDEHTDATIAGREVSDERQTELRDKGRQ